MKYISILLLFLNIGCARFPENFSDTRETKIKFSVTVEGKINKDYIYLIALATSKDLNPIQEHGPFPVTEFPWGNGLVRGECTHYIIWKPNATPPFELYKFVDKDLETSRFIGSPIVFSSIEPGLTNKISFELTTGQLAQGSALKAEEIKSLKVNFITMNLIPNTESDQLISDSLGTIGDPTQRAWITVPLNANMIYDNIFYGSKKPSGTISDPDLKISDFSIEVIQSST